MLRRHAVDARWRARSGPEGEVLRRCVEIAWTELRAAGVSWIGFYEKPVGRDEMVLVCREPRPACSPIGLHGACGRCWREGRPLIVTDVAHLGENYIACDPRDRSEVVVPVMLADGSCWGVLDVDSYEVGAFDERDVQGLDALMRALGITEGQWRGSAVRV
jgi:putative methionine-R-sulfoxide reductase with GAF domain